MYRRNFLKVTGASVFSGLLIGEGVNVFGQKRDYFPLPQTIYSEKGLAFNRQTFEPLINTTFAFKNDDSAEVSMKLIEVVAKNNTKSYSSRIPTDSFTLIFEMRGKNIAEDKIYQVSHSALGDFSMFISTVGKSGRLYQAVYNRINL